MTYQNRHDSYLASKALTASPHRLHLMLLEGAIRFGRQAAEALQQGDESSAATPLMRVVDIAGELLAGVRQQRTDLNTRLAKLYLYLFHTASVAKINSDPEKLADALALLEFERETWQMLCERLGADIQADDRSTCEVGPSLPMVRLPIEPPQNGPSPGLSLQA